MSLLQMQLNKDLKYGQVFQGTGDQDPRDREVRYYQHGLYFRADGSLAKDSPLNAEKIKLIESLGGNEAEPVAPVQVPDRAPVNPEVVAKLADKTDEEVQAIAERMVEALTVSNTEFDYEPVVTEREANIRFIAQYAS